MSKLLDLELQIKTIQKQEVKLIDDRARNDAETLKIEAALTEALASEALGDKPAASVATLQKQLEQCRQKELGFRAALTKLGQRLDQLQGDLRAAQIEDLQQRLNDIQATASKIADTLEKAELTADKSKLDLFELHRESRVLLGKLAALQGDNNAVRATETGTQLAGPVGSFRDPSRALDLWRVARQGGTPILGLPDFKPTTLRAALFDRYDHLQIRGHQ